MIRDVWRGEPLRVCSLFSGIGGFEVGLNQAGHETIFQCENDPAALAVLKRRFPSIRRHRDIKSLKALPRCDILTAGWPCQDLSQAGSMAGIGGSRSKLITEVFRLIDRSRSKPDFVVLENVAFSLHLHEGAAIRKVTRRLQRAGYNWAYRVLDTQEFGLPQRRRRVFIVGTRNDKSPLPILFDGTNNVSDVADARYVGFYWTEGNRGIGWTPEAIPPLKSGSAFSIPSPPAIWDKKERTFFVPSLQDAERLQGFRSGWTSPVSEIDLSERVRWRLVGNAVSVPIAKWIGKRLSAFDAERLSFLEPTEGKTARRINLAWGGPHIEARFAFVECEGPRKPKSNDLSEFKFKQRVPLSSRAAAGVLARLVESPLRIEKKFLRDLAAFCGRKDLIANKAA